MAGGDADDLRLAVRCRRSARFRKVNVSPSMMPIPAPEYVHDELQLV
jgi:hypothetical protein